MRMVQSIVVGLIALGSLGAGPVYHEPATYTGEAIERAIENAYKDIRGRVFLPGGTYKITRTIRLNGLGPLIIEGASPAIPSLEWNHASSVMLEWWGPKDQPMIRLDTTGIQLKYMMLDGRGIASHGVVLANSPAGGTAINRLQDVHFYNFTVACFQAGEKADDQNAADSYFDRVGFFRAPAGFRSVNNQSVNNEFSGCQFGWLERALDIERGGAVSLSGGGLGGVDVVIKLGASGHNTGPIHIGPLRVERNGYKKRYMTLIDARPPEGPHYIGSGQIRLVSLRMADGGFPDAPDVETPLMRIGAGVHVVAEGCLFKAAGNQGQWPMAYVEGSNSGGASLRSEDSQWWGNLESIVSNDKAFVEIVGSANHANVRVPPLRRGTP